MIEAKEFPRSIDSPMQILCHPAVEAGKKSRGIREIGGKILNRM